MHVAKHAPGNVDGGSEGAMAIEFSGAQNHILLTGWHVHVSTLFEEGKLVVFGNKPRFAHTRVVAKKSEAADGGSVGGFVLGAHEVGGTLFAPVNIGKGIVFWLMEVEDLDFARKRGHHDILWHHDAVQIIVNVLARNREKHAPLQDVAAMRYDGGVHGFVPREIFGRVPFGKKIVAVIIVFNGSDKGLNGEQMPQRLCIMTIFVVKRLIRVHNASALLHFVERGFMRQHRTAIEPRQVDQDEKGELDVVPDFPHAVG